MLDRPNALLVVEGGQRETALFGRIVELLKMQFRIVPVCCKIYELYRILERENFDVDIQLALKELNISDADKKVLDENSFASIFLVYDCDVHDPLLNCVKEHVRLSDGEADWSLNMSAISRMIAKMNNDTDPTCGKLYVNYPMLESFCDCDMPFDEAYAERTCDPSRGRLYKSDVARRKMNVDVSTYSAESIWSLALQNVYKANWLVNGKWARMSEQQFFSVDKPICALIHDRQTELVTSQKMLAVINSSMFLPLDYFGRLPAQP